MELGNIHDDDGYVNAVLGNGNDKELEVSSSLRQSLLNTYRCTTGSTSVFFSRLVVAVGLQVYVYVYVYVYGLMQS
jgi:hypothetical protein